MHVTPRQDEVVKEDKVWDAPCGLELGAGLLDTSLQRDGAG